MKQAELFITISSWAGPGSIHCIDFDSVSQAQTEFDRIADLLKKRGDKGNDLPRFLDVEGINKVTCDFTQICAVAMNDLKKSDEAAIGLKDAYPHLSWKP